MEAIEHAVVTQKRLILTALAEGDLPFGCGEAAWHAAAVELQAERDRYREALVEGFRQLSRFDFKGPKQVGRAMLTLERAIEVDQP